MIAHSRSSAFKAVQRFVLSVVGNGRMYNGYDNVDDSNVETAAPHQSLDQKNTHTDQ